MSFKFFILFVKWFKAFLHNTFKMTILKLRNLSGRWVTVRYNWSAKNIKKSSVVVILGSKYIFPKLLFFLWTIVKYLSCFSVILPLRLRLLKIVLLTSARSCKLFCYWVVLLLRQCNRYDPALPHTNPCQLFYGYVLIIS